VSRQRSDNVRWRLASGAATCPPQPRVTLRLVFWKPQAGRLGADGGLREDA
jgi:hypothetical protein